ncbi:MAG: prenyltransferase/squalene oxidase repeat-containing protein [Planctomycetaceae bacterium]
MMLTNRSKFRFAQARLCLVTLVVAVVLQPAWSLADTSREDLIRTTAARGIEYLKTRGQAEDGSFSRESGSAVTSLCVAAILMHRPEAKNDPTIKRALAFIESNIRGDGGVYAEGSKHKNYETCIATAALIEANENGKYDSVLARAKVFIKDLQWDEGEGVTKSDPAYGGAGYGSHSRPDLSNTSFMIEALRNLGEEADDEAIQKALMFVARSQNLPGHGNDTPHAQSVGDGGFYYTPAAGGSSQAGNTPEGGLRSYASMTYAGLKSMIFAGLTPEDPRVEAALSFIRKNYDLESNPGMGTAGLYYYYHTFAKALSVAGIEVLDDAEGTPHVWRDELVKTLAEAQMSDGSWVNRANDRWMEGNSNLVTAYALLSLAYCKQ